MNIKEERFSFKNYEKPFLIFYVIMLLMALYVFTNLDKNVGNLIPVIFFPFIYIPWFFTMKKFESHAKK